MEDEIILIGVDFSLISPSVCILKEGKLKFISFFNDYGKKWQVSKSKQFQYHRILDETGIVEMIPYTRSVDDSDYRTEQSTKMIDAQNLAKLIVDRLKKEIGDCPVKIGLEGFSYASSGASYIDLIMYNCFFRSEVIKEFGDCLVIISPTEGKKHFSGKGNANKEKMIEAFITNYVNDTKIEETELWKFCNENELDYSYIKPIDDLIDSCGILESVIIDTKKEGK